jgi:hypothetical protein
MPLTLDPSVGGANSNTFADLDYYKLYLQTRLPAPSFLSAALSNSIDEKLKADLIVSCRILNASFTWTGSPATTTQALTWSRSGMFNRNGVAIPENINPNELKDAQCELAIQVRSADLVSDDQAAKKNVKRVKAGSVEVEFQDSNANDFSEADTIISKLSRDFDYTRIPNQVRLLLVPSWYTENSLINNELIFEVF